MLLLASPSPSTITTAAYAHHGPAVLTASTTTPAPATVSRATVAGRLAKLSARRALLIARAQAISASLRSSRTATTASTETGGVETWRPAARGSLIGAHDAEPILTPAERLRVRLAVQIARDAAEWEIGRAVPCYWLTVS